MADPMGGALVSALVKLTLNKLATPAFQKISRIIGVKDELTKLGNTLSSIDAVLLDAEEQQTALHSVRIWLRNLKDVAYDIEDLLDLISTHDLENKVNGTRPATLSLRFRLARKLKAICHRLDEIATNRMIYNFQERFQLGLPSSLESSLERETCSFVQQSHVFGREEDKEWIVTRLLSSSSKENVEIPVLPIVGMGGMGKTTLAKLVLNDPRIIENFDLKLWVCLPNRFDLKTVMNSIVQSATAVSFSGLNLEAIKNRLHHVLCSGTFVLVLDNVWLEDSSLWLELKDLLDVGSKRSRVIVMTREDRVASIAGTMEAFKLKPLPDDHCWSIFVRCAFREGEQEAYPLLVQIGKIIVKKCCGVPLAAKTLGSQLRTVRDVTTWRMIKDSELWKISQTSSDILPALKLSLDKLPFHIRSCFLFCSTTPKGEYILKEWILLEWMALGLLESKEMNGALEDIGDRHFEELMYRSFFEVVDYFAYAVRSIAMQKNVSEAVLGTKLNNMKDRALSYGRTQELIKHVQMHDVMHDLATFVSAEETLIISCNNHEVSEKVRFIVWKTEGDLLERGQLPKQLLKAKRARSLAVRPKRISCMSKLVLDALFSSFICLRIMKLDGLLFEELPNSIGKLKHLRLLNLSHNNRLKGLPNSICKLVNLQTLNNYLCINLERFPRDLHKLLSLRYLLFTSNLTHFPESSFHGWTSMQHIKICDCKNLACLPDQVEMLTTLRVLRIDRCPNLTSLPNSIANLTSLEVLQIYDCEKLDLMGWEGLYGTRSLRHLNIQQLPLLVQFPDGLQCVSGSLECLIVKLCPNLMALPDCLGLCTCLLKLTIYKCPSLCTLPLGIQGVKRLQELWIDGCPELTQKCERDRGECWYLISHIPVIQLDRRFA